MMSPNCALLTTLVLMPERQQTRQISFTSLLVISALRLEVESTIVS
jgi:hypothetical protein